MPLPLIEQEIKYVKSNCKGKKKKKKNALVNYKINKTDDYYSLSLIVCLCFVGIRCRHEVSDFVHGKFPRLFILSRG